MNLLAEGYKYSVDLLKISLSKNIDLYEEAENYSEKNKYRMSPIEYRFLHSAA